MLTRNFSRVEEEKMSSEFIFDKGSTGDTDKTKTGEPLLGSLAYTSDEGLRQKPMTRKPIHCDSDHCGLPAICSVEFRFFCVGHFISHCYERLDEFAKLPAGDVNEKLEKSVDRFLQECSQQAASLVDPIRGLDNLERARLFDIFLWASELSAKRRVFTKPETIDTAYRINRRGV